MITVQLLIATTNQKKGGEMRQILSEALPGLSLLTLADLPPAPEVDETGETFAENARLKARAALSHFGMPSIADDGGLVIDALDGAPGVKSHRFLGESTSFADKMARILEMMADVPDSARTCRFQCAVAIALPDGRVLEYEGRCEGRIAHKPAGSHGFGYDPIFYLPNRRCCMAELLPEEKHKLSHRGMALGLAITGLSQVQQEMSVATQEFRNTCG